MGFLSDIVVVEYMKSINLNIVSFLFLLLYILFYLLIDFMEHFIARVHTWLFKGKYHWRIMRILAIIFKQSSLSQYTFEDFGVVKSFEVMFFNKLCELHGIDQVLSKDSANFIIGEELDIRIIIKYSFLFILVV
jgi:hypothetical protein